MIPKGTYKARAQSVLAEEAFGESPQKGTKYVRLKFNVQGGEHDGESVDWTGFFTEKTTARTIDSLRYCGVSGDDLMDLSGVDSNVVDIVVEHETWTPDTGDRAGEPQTRARVAWVNGGSAVPEAQRLGKSKLAGFAASMKGAMLESRKRVAPAAPASPNAAPRGRGTAAPADGGYYGSDEGKQDIPF